MTVYVATMECFEVKENHTNYTNIIGVYSSLSKANRVCEEYEFNDLPQTTKVEEQPIDEWSLCPREVSITYEDGSVFIYTFNVDEYKVDKGVA